MCAHLCVCVHMVYVWWRWYVDLCIYGIYVWCIWYVYSGMCVYMGCGGMCVYMCIYGMCVTDVDVYIWYVW